MSRLFRDILHHQLQLAGQSVSMEELDVIDGQLQETLQTGADLGEEMEFHRNYQTAVESLAQMSVDVRSAGSSRAQVDVLLRSADIIATSFGLPAQYQASCESNTDGEQYLLSMESGFTESVKKIGARIMELIRRFIAWLRDLGSKVMKSFTGTEQLIKNAEKEAEESSREVTIPSNSADGKPKRKGSESVPITLTPRCAALFARGQYFPQVHEISLTMTRDNPISLVGAFVINNIARRVIDGVAIMDNDIKARGHLGLFETLAKETPQKTLGLENGEHGFMSGVEFGYKDIFSHVRTGDTDPFSIQALKFVKSAKFTFELIPGKDRTYSMSFDLYKKVLPLVLKTHRSVNTTYLAVIRRAEEEMAIIKKQQQTFTPEKFSAMSMEEGRTDAEVAIMRYYFRHYCSTMIEYYGKLITHTTKQKQAQDGAIKDLIRACRVAFYM